MHYFTFFSNSYLPQALVLIESIYSHDPEAVVICGLLDHEAIAVKEIFPRVVCFSWSEVLDSQPQLSETIRGREFADKIFSSVPGLIQSALALVPDGASLLYLDADTALLNDPKFVFEELGSAAIGVFPHRFTGPLKNYFARYGDFNAGALLVRNSFLGQQFLDEWGRLCIHWCYDFPSKGKYSNQGYLNSLSSLTGCVSLVRSNGNIGPWNSGLTNLKLRSGKLQFDNSPVVFFHFHGMQRMGAIWILGHLRYLKVIGLRVAKSLYGPYLDRLEHYSAQVGIQVGISKRLNKGRLLQAGLVAISLLLLQFVRVYSPAQRSLRLSDPSSSP